MTKLEIQKIIFKETKVVKIISAIQNAIFFGSILFIIFFLILKTTYWQIAFIPAVLGGAIFGFKGYACPFLLFFGEATFSRFQKVNDRQVSDYAVQRIEEIKKSRLKNDEYCRKIIEEHQISIEKGEEITKNQILQLEKFIIK